MLEVCGVHLSSILIGISFLDWRVVASPLYTVTMNLIEVLI